MKCLHSTWIAVAAGVGARIAWVLAGPDVVFTDAAAYRALAHAIANGHAYVSSAGPSAYWVPGWPAWMALFYGAGASDRAVALGSVLLGAITIACVWAFAREAAGDRAARIAAALCALAPSLVLLPGVLLSENLALPLVALAALAMLRAHRRDRALDWALFGLAAGAATLVRESSAAMLLGGAWLAIRTSTSTSTSNEHEHEHEQRVTSHEHAQRARVSSAHHRASAWRMRAISLAAMLAAFAVVTAPWVLRNREAMGATALTTSAGVNLCIGLGEGATGGFRALDHIADPLDANEVMRHRSGLRCAEEGLAHHPLELVTLAPAKLSRLVAWDDWIVDDFIERAAPAKTGLLGALRVLCNVFWWTLCAACAALAWKNRGDESAKRIIEATAAIALTVALAALVTFGAGRFHTPLVPLLAALAGGCYRRAP